VISQPAPCYPQKGSAMAFMKPKADKQIKAPAKAKAPAARRIEVSGVASVLIQGGSALVIADGKQETVTCSNVAIVIEG